MRLFALLFVLLFAEGILSSPIPLKIHQPWKLQGDKADIKRIVTATDEAEARLQKMRHVLQNPNVPEHKAHIEYAFGTNADPKKILENVNKMLKGRLTVTRVRGGLKGAKAVGVPNKGKIGINDAFHNLSPSDRVGTLIHEAAHAMTGALDRFTVQGEIRPITKAEADDMHESQYRYGYAHREKDFEANKKHAGHVMHMNADSYKVLAHTLTNGLPKSALPPVSHEPPRKKRKLSSKLHGPKSATRSRAPASTKAVKTKSLRQKGAPVKTKQSTSSRKGKRRA